MGARPVGRRPGLEPTTYRTSGKPTRWTSRLRTAGLAIILTYLGHQTVRLVDPNVFETANAGFAQAMYEEFLRDPTAVGPEWRRLFESGIVGERPSANGGTGRDGGRARPPQPPPRPRRQPVRPIARRHPPLRSAPRCRSDQGTRRQAGREHGAEPHGADRHHLPGGSGGRPGGAAQADQRRRSRPRPARQDLLHPPDRLRAGAGHQAPPRDGPHPRHAGRDARTGCNRRVSPWVWRWTCSARTAAGAWSCR